MSTELRGEPTRRGLPTVLVVVLQALVTVTVFAAVGAGAGLLWFRLWTPPSGVVQSGQWFIPDEAGLRAEFSGTGLYVVLALVAGLLVGAVVAVLLDRSELVTLACVVGGAVLAGWVMYRVGIQDSPPDPRALAPPAADGTVLPGDLTLARSTPFVAFPTGALLGYAVLLLVVPKRGSQGRPDSPEAAFRDPRDG
ncbi:MAG: hypothetical protein LH468_02940 [Nocardioides sp.]|nr:hypothetical protein [Nocardioides sp.]